MGKRTVVITGAADGIGLATAERFARENYRVAIVDINLEKAQERAVELGDGHLALKADVSDERQVEIMAAAAIEAFGSIHVLVNNAGIGDAHLPTLEQNVDRFRRVLDVHVAGCFLVSRAFARHMLDNREGAIVNISSIAGVVGLPRRNAYGAAKAGIVAMTKSMACEWAAQGIRVNAVAPGYVETELVRKLAEAGQIDLETIRKRVPMGALGNPADIAEAIWFLASPAARYITGTILGVDGGWSAFGDFGDAHA